MTCSFASMMPARRSDLVLGSRRATRQRRARLCQRFSVPAAGSWQMCSPAIQEPVLEPLQHLGVPAGAPGSPHAP